jgi:peptidoglycan/LPS O-acetylase OafA/YrhL
MGEVQNTNQRERYLPCLSGIRGYGFLLVFVGHYILPDDLARPGTMRLQALTALWSLGFFAVPAFFVLSGYLIGGILYHTRNREGYFRVFYARRVLRIFPVFYLALAAIGIFLVMHSQPLDRYFWSNFLYIHNLLPGYREHATSGPVGVIHFWSLAVEEQFYLIWPLIVWLFPERRKLVGITVGLVAFCSAVRLAAPLVLPSPSALGTFTISRADAILLGALIALIQHEGYFERIRPYAKWFVLGGAVTSVVLGIEKGSAWADTFSGRELLIPLANFMAAAILIAVMEENSFLNRMCSQKWACWLGGLSYSLYVFHNLFTSYFRYTLTPRLELYMRSSLAVVASTALAFCFTLLLSILCYRFVESPLMNLKRHLRYGGVSAQREAAAEIAEPVLVEMGS